MLATALSRAFDPGFQAEGSPLYLVPDKTGRLMPQWIPSASTAAAPLVDNGRGGKGRATDLSAAEVHAAWSAFLKSNADKLKWDPVRCCFTAGSQ